MGTAADYSSAIYVRPMKYATPPKGFKTDVRGLNDSIRVVFSWEPISNPKIAGYYLYYYNENYKQFLKSSDKITKTTYNKLITRSKSEKIKYCLSSVDINDYESELGDTLTVITPSTFLPSPSFSWTKDQEKRELTLEWKYNGDYLDLKGFRMYLNGRVYGDENKLKANTRSFTEGEMSRGYYKIQMQAISIYGVESELSSVKEVRFR